MGSARLETPTADFKIRPAKHVDASLDRSQVTGPGEVPSTRAGAGGRQVPSDRAGRLTAHTRLIWPRLPAKRSCVSGYTTDQLDDFKAMGLRR